MPSDRLPDAEFWKLHTANRQTDRYRALRRRKLESVGFRCCVCGDGYLKKGYGKWQLQMDHVHYRDANGLIFGRETLTDFRVCCPDHHGKGVRSDDTVRLLSGSNVVERFVVWLLLAFPRLLWWLAVLSWRLVSSRWSGKAPAARDRSPRLGR